MCVCTYVYPKHAGSTANSSAHDSLPRLVYICMCMYIYIYVQIYVFAYIYVCLVYIFTLNTQDLPQTPAHATYSHAFNVVERVAALSK